MSNLEKLVRLLTSSNVDVHEAFERIRAVVEYMGCRAVLIGSRAEGRAMPASDIDILVICKTLPQSMLEIGRIKAEIMDRANIDICSNVHIEIVAEDYAKYYLRK
ncbi:MAG: nucleotidyltransferase domain-containing protein [Ignisphaera sp.]